MAARTLINLRDEYTDLGSQNVGTVGTAQTVFLQASGNSALTISSITAASNGGSTSDFLIDATACTSAAVQAGNQCPVSVRFQPTAAGVRKATFLVNDSASGSPHELYFQGTGIAVNAPAVSFSPQRVDFGNQAVSTPSNAAAVTVTNAGTAALTISTVTSDTAAFTVSSNTCTSSIAANAHCTFNVTFTPTQQTSYSGAITVADNASGSPHVVPVTGTGAASGGGTPVLDTFSFRGPVNYGDVPVNGHQDGLIAIHNMGTAPLVVTSCTLSNDDFTISSGCPVTVAPGASSDLHVGGIPQAVGQRTTTLTITDNASGSPHSITLTENGTGAPVAQLPATLDLGNQPVSTTGKANAVTLHNAGNVPLHITNVATGSEFAQTNDCGASLAANTTCTINVKFTPAQLGQRTGTLTITDDAAGGSQTVALSGTGTTAPPKITNLSTLSVPTAGGTQITITGTGFQTGAAVLFGGVSGTIVGTPTATSITVTTPAHDAGSVDVVIANPDGQYSDVYVGFSYIPPGYVPSVGQKPNGPPASGGQPPAAEPGQRPNAPPAAGNTPPNSLPGGR